MSLEVPPAILKLSNDLNIKTDLVIESQEWHSLDTNFENYITHVVKSVLVFTGHTNNICSFQVSFLLTNDETLKKLNKQYRNKDKTTNVLSFPYQGMTPDISFIKANQNNQYLGDVAISYEKILEESIHFERTFIEHFTHIIVHSVLHLLGYDHVIDKDAEIMEGLENKILDTLGFGKTYRNSFVS